MNSAIDSRETNLSDFLGRAIAQPHASIWQWKYPKHESVWLASGLQRCCRRVLRAHTGSGAFGTSRGSPPRRRWGEKFGWFSREHIRQAAKNKQRGIADATFNLRNIGSINLRSEGKPLLRQTYITSQTLDVLRQNAPRLLISLIHKEEDVPKEILNPRNIIYDATRRVEVLYKLHLKGGFKLQVQKTRVRRNVLRLFRSMISL